jgi:hypothetical protein
VGETTNEYRMLTENQSVTGIIEPGCTNSIHLAQGWNQWWVSVNIMKLGGSTNPSIMLSFKFQLLPRMEGF